MTPDTTALVLDLAHFGVQSPCDRRLPHYARVGDRACESHRPEPLAEFGFVAWVHLSEPHATSGRATMESDSFSASSSGAALHATFMGSR